MNTLVMDWVTNGEKKSEIYYMKINDSLNYLIVPQKIEVNNVHNDVSKIIDEARDDDGLDVKFRSIVTQYNHHRDDSFTFHNCVISKCAASGCKFEKKSVRLSGRKERKMFKYCLKKLGFSVSNALDVDLWSIYFKATQKNIISTIKKIWSLRNGALRTVKNKKDCNEFIKQVNENYSSV